MERQLTHIGNQLVVICCAVCGVVFVVGLLRGYASSRCSGPRSRWPSPRCRGLPAVATTTLALASRGCASSMCSSAI